VGNGARGGGDEVTSGLVDSNTMDTIMTNLAMERWRWWYFPFDMPRTGIRALHCTDRKLLTQLEELHTDVQ
jgi:hypothetical protein